jgi:hypothetical protein
MNEASRIRTKNNPDYSKNYYEKNKDSVLKKAKSYRELNAEKITKYRKKQWIEKKEILSEKNKKYRLENKEKISERIKVYCKINALKISEQRKKFYHKNIEKIRESSKAYLLKNREKKLKYNRRYYKKRVAEDCLYSLKIRTRCLVSSALRNKGHTKRATTTQILGCSYGELKVHLESQFLDGMSWENRSEWHIDHFIPLASAKSESEILKLNHYSNLRPMWAIDNIRKGAKMPHEHNYK